MLHYTVLIPDPRTHQVDVRLRFRCDCAGEVVLRLPVWIPGSYLVREFARHVIALFAVRVEGNRPIPLPVVKSAKQSWVVKGVRARAWVEVRYSVWAYDASVREAFVGSERVLLNGTSLFLVPAGQLEQPCLLELLPVAERPTWRVATTLAAVEVDARGFGRYRAPDYHTLVDSPISIGVLERLAFAVAGVRHEVVVTGAAQPWDGERLARDLCAVCATQAALFGGLPFDRYLFHLHVTDSGYGGLEHRESSVLLASRADLPWQGMAQPSDGYLRLLGLFSHEYLHAWVVKRLRPRSFLTYDYFQEQPTSLLWLFEGWVAYYNDLFLCRAGVIDADRYLGLLGETLTRVVRDPGHTVQSLADASFDAWIKFYRPHPHSASLFANYYTKGAVVACALDWRLRLKGSSLDALLLTLWRAFGREERGVTEAEVLDAVEALGGQGARRWLFREIHEARTEPLSALAPKMGVRLVWHYEEYPGLGVRWESGRDPLLVGQVLADSPAERGGLAPGDEVVAIDRLRVTAGNWREQLARYVPGTAVTIGLFREGVWQELPVTLGPPAVKAVKVVRAARRGQGAERLAAWLRAGADRQHGAG